MKIDNLETYLVSFTYKIPVRVKATKSATGEKEAAYYKARDAYYDFSLNEADVTITKISEEEYNERNEVVAKLHDKKWQ